MEIPKHVKYFIGYSAASAIALGISIYNALAQSNNVLSLLFVLTDGVDLGVVLNFLLCLFILFSTSLQYLIFGELRIIEREHVMERLPIFTINLLLNLTTKDNNLMLNVLLLMITLFSKVMHSILVDRMESQQIKMVNNLSTSGPYDSTDVFFYYIKNPFFHWNLVFLSIDFLIAKFLVYDIFQGINSVPCLLFGFLFAVQGLESFSIFLKDLLDFYELAKYPVNSEEDIDDIDDIDLDDLDNSESADKVWENKALYSKSIEIIFSSFKTLSFVAFIYLLSFHANSSIPISMLQGTYLSARQTYKDIKQLLSFIEQSKRLDTQLPNANADDLVSDNLCIICREDMLSPTDYEAAHNRTISSRLKPKKLPCNHILHMGCLKDWLERSDNCPLCRRKVFTAETEPQVPETEIPQAEPHQVAEPVPLVTEFNIPPVHRAPVANNRFGDFEELLQHHRQQNGGADDQGITRAPEPTATVNNEVNEPAVSTSILRQSIPDLSEFTGTSNHAVQHITLPRNAFLPPDWEVFPLERTIRPGVDYTIRLSSLTGAELTIRQNPRRGDIAANQNSTTATDSNE